MCILWQHKLSLLNLRSILKNLDTIKNIAWLSLPVLLTNVMQSLVQIIDTLMVGRLGPEEIAAIGLGNTLRLFVFIFVLSVSAGAMSLVAQAKGARDHKRISFITRQAISSGILVSIALGIIGIIFAKPILTLMEQGGSEKVIDLSYRYLVVLFIGTPFLLLNFEAPPKSITS